MSRRWGQGLKRLMFIVISGPPEVKEASKDEPEVKIQVKDGTFEMDGKTYRVNDMAALLEVGTLCHSPPLESL